MTDPTTHPLSPRLRELSDAVTQGREAVAREFTMRVPAEPDRDADLVLSRAAAELDRQAAEIARLRAEVEALREDAERLDTRAIRLGDTVFADVDLRAAIDAARTPEDRSDG